MSNKRNTRRRRQRVRHEKSRRPVVITKAMDAFIAKQPGERNRKERERYYKKPTKAERKAREKRWRDLVLHATPTRRKPRKVHGATFWGHSHDV